MVVDGDQMYIWCSELFPIFRSLTGDGVRKTLDYIDNIIGNLDVNYIPSGSVAFDWTVPKEWNIKEAWIKDPTGNKIIDMNTSNLHVLGYSIPIHKKMQLGELNKHLHSLPDQPNAIPYVTSYYKERWGFSLTHSQRSKLLPGEYEVFIDSTLEDGYLNFGELLLEGESKKEILISTYICHPSMANNELSGPAVVMALAKWLKATPTYYSYRILFVPETIGSIVYICKNIEHLKKYTAAGFVVTCVGDDDNYSFVNTPEGNTLADEVAEYAANICSFGKYKRYSFLERGSDERQYCSAGVDLPVVSLCRTKYNEFNEYHTSLDDLDFISPQGLEGGLRFLQTAIRILEKNVNYRVAMKCEPQLGKRGLYPTVSTKDTVSQTRTMMNFLAYANGHRSLLDIAKRCNVDFFELDKIASDLSDAKVIVKNEIG